MLKTRTRVGLQCPRCLTPFVRRSRRVGLADQLLGSVYLYPFRCQLCRHRFHVFQPGTRYLPVERRDYERLPIQLPATFRWDGREGDGLVTELSVAGCALQSGAALTVGDRVRLTLEPPAPAPAITVALAAVRGIRPRGVGLEFVEVPEPDRSHLREFVRDWLRRYYREA